MERPCKIAPSILSANFAVLGEEIHRVEKAGADLIHVDVMDGHFVPNLSIGIPVLKAVRAVTRLALDVHLMIEQPDRYLEPFAKAGADMISVHAEVCPDLPAIAHKMHQLGIGAAVAINPETAPDRVVAAAAHFNMILVMSVHPGFGGQAFIPETLEKLRTVKREIDKLGLATDLEVDGGIKLQNIAEAAAAGANVFVSGSGIFGQPDYAAVISQMRQAAAARR